MPSHTATAASPIQRGNGTAKTMQLPAARLTPLAKPQQPENVSRLASGTAGIQGPAVCRPADPAQVATADLGVLCAGWSEWSNRAIPLLPHSAIDCRLLAGWRKSDRVGRAGLYPHPGQPPESYPSGW